MTVSVSCSQCGRQFKNLRPEMQGRKAKCRCGAIVKIPASKSKPIPTADVSIQSPKRTDQATEEPFVADTFSDLDSILDGAGDTAPIMVPTKPRSTKVQGQQQRTTPASKEADRSTASTEKKPSQPKPNARGFLFAVLAGTLAIWVGALLVVSRFKVIEIVLLSHLSRQIQAGYRGEFGMLDVPIATQSVFCLVGWGVWGIGLLMILVGITQVVNAFVRMLVRRTRFGWSDGLMASLAFLAVVLLGCMVLSQMSLQSHLASGLQPAEQQFDPFEGGELPFENETITRLKAEYASVAWNFNGSIVACGVICLVISIASIIRLFAQMRVPAT